ncbi:MAG: hypothetical protein KDA78_03940 [Planctomycetaceae bacterium]|nr:hypothetical protein [Planctomycetaceae bacterium]
MSQISHSRPLPAVIERTLHQVRWYAIGIAIVESVAISAAVFIGLLILAMTLDWIMTISESGVRTLISGIVYAVSAAVLSGNLWSRISRVLTNRQLSMRIDRQIPQLEERWSTVVQLNGTNGRPVPPLQQQMLSQVTSEAVALSSLVEPRQISRSETLKSALVAMVMAILLLAGFLSIHWQQTSVLWQRFFQPTLLLTATQLDVGEVVSPLARGEIAELKIIQSGVLRQHGVLTIEYESGHEEQLRLNPEADLPEHFVHSLRAGETFRFRFAAGDALTEWHSIRVIDAPDFEQVELTVIAPEYTGQEPHTKRPSCPDI